MNKKVKNSRKKKSAFSFRVSRNETFNRSQDEEVMSFWSSHHFQGETTTLTTMNFSCVGMPARFHGKFCSTLANAGINIFWGIVEPSDMDS